MQHYTGPVGLEAEVGMLQHLYLGVADFVPRRCLRDRINSIMIRSNAVGVVSLPSWIIQSFDTLEPLTLELPASWEHTPSAARKQAPVEQWRRIA